MAYASVYELGLDLSSVSMCTHIGITHTFLVCMSISESF